MNPESTVDDDIQAMAGQSATLRAALMERFGRQTHYTRDQLDTVFAASVVPSSFHSYGIAMFAKPSDRPGLLQRIHSSKTAHELRKWLLAEVFCFCLSSDPEFDDLDFHEVLEARSATSESSDEDSSNGASDFDDGE